VSDLHAYDTLAADEAQPSHLCTTSPEDQPTQHPITGLLDLIAKQPIIADALICCGDMGDKSRPAGIRYVWEKLQKLKEALGAKDLFATAGNHDIDSRYSYNDYDAKGILQALLPMYPLPDENLTNKYWSRNYVVLSRPDYRIVILNSSAYHGTKDEEFKTGRVSLRTVESLRMELEELEKDEPKLVNILLCHHHPHKYGDIDETDYSDMEGAPKLLEVLGSGNFGDWIAIHGHKHHPRLCYAAGLGNAPVIFSAGSLTAVLYPALQLAARNQFYVIEFPLQDIRNLNLGLVGTFESWDWTKGLGWRRAGPQSGLPAFGGFGNQNRGLVVDAIEASVKARGENFVQWSEVATDVPGLKYLMPGDLEIVIAKLRSDRALNVLRDDFGQPAQIGKKP